MLARPDSRHVNGHRGRPLEAGDDHPHHGNLELWPGQVHRHHLCQTSTPQALQHPAQVRLQRSAPPGGHLVKITSRLSPHPRAQLRQPGRLPGARVVAPTQVIPGARNGGQPHLRCLRERPPQGHLPRRMAPHPEHGAHRLQRTLWLQQCAQTGRNTHIRGDVPRGHLQTGLFEAGKHLTAPWIRHGLQGQLAPRPPFRAVQEPQRDRVPLHHLAEAVADRLQPVVARSQPIRTGQEGAAARREGEGIVGVNQLERQPQRCAAEQLMSLDPEQAQLRMEIPCRGSRQGRHVHERMGEAQFLEAGELDRRENPLGMVVLHGFHQARRLRRGQIQPFALEDRQRPGIRPTHHHDGDADNVQARDVRDPGDAKHREQRAQPLDRLLGRNGAVGARLSPPCRKPEHAPRGGRLARPEARDAHRGRFETRLIKLFRRLGVLRRSARFRDAGFRRLGLGRGLGRLAPLSLRQYLRCRALLHVHPVKPAILPNDLQLLHRLPSPTQQFPPR
ncbi:conserved hypothetical protein [Stigmatella aurantiaca DW4/3-1]|uniref:Uncharacterized protein n=1 Tax=Stigmatella aurantiaca (strain DW4/3-1) TaxID=378806 RepID=Q09B74_STIAD|nr:conserved hypothetical protein [Stigmatella aurantiaca DW4/3-1]